jgi:hypothetical protein
MLEIWVPCILLLWPTITPLWRIWKKVIPNCLSLACCYCWFQLSTLRSCCKSLCPKCCNSRVSQWHPVTTSKNWWSNQIEGLGICRLPNNGTVTKMGRVTW